MSMINNIIPVSIALPGNVNFASAKMSAMLRGFSISEYSHMTSDF